MHGKPFQEAANQARRRSESTGMRFQGTLLYVCLLFLVLGMISSFIMIWIIPKFKAIFEGFEIKLPRITEILIDISNWVIRDGDTSTTNDITIPASTSLAAGAVMAFDHVFGWLNNAGDSITLFDNSATTIDSVAYGTAVGAVVAEDPELHLVAVEERVGGLPPLLHLPRELHGYGLTSFNTSSTS